MREILFRGQTRRKGEKVRMAGTPVESNWVYGGIFQNNDGGDFAIIYQQEPEIEKFPVYSDTVGQYTGLLDKNGKMIFEGDIIKEDDCIGVVKFGKYVNPCDPDLLGGHIGFYVSFKNDLLRKELAYWSDISEVIGNIFDNPELLAED